MTGMRTSRIPSGVPSVYPVRMRHLWPALLALMVVLLSSVACYDQGSDNGPIKSFVAERSTLTKGLKTKLVAVFESGTGTIDNGIGEVTSGVPVETAVLTGNTTFTLTVEDETGSFTQSVEITAIDPAVITSFKPDGVILPGQSTNLTAVFSGGEGVVDNGIGPVKSGVPVSTGVVAATKIYTLTVTNSAGDPVTATAEVEAAVTPVITSFTAPGPVVSRFAPTDLTAVFTGGKGVVDQNVGPIVSNMPTKTPAVPPAGLTYTLTVTNGLGEKVTKTLSVTTKKEMFVTDYGGDVLVYDADATGDVPPKRTILTGELKNLNSGIVGILGIAVTNDSVIIANEGGTPSLSVFGIGDIDDIVPKGRIRGAATTLSAGTNGAYMLSVANGEVFVADKSSIINVWNVTDTGDIAPRRVLGGAATALDNCLATWIDSGELYVSNYANAGASTITVYPQAASGNTAPSRTIDVAGTEPTGILVAGNELFVNSKPGAITVYDKTTGAQLRKITGAATQITELYQCSVSDGELFCASYLLDRIVVFPANATGNVAPTRTLMGDKTYLASPASIVVF
jgi:hypothetical protein